jgi:NDP-sugar pyrophosphorylase family protein
MSTRFEGVMKAVILAGGQGTRLLPYTASLPKAMMPIGNKPILEVVVRQLHALGVEEILLATGYLEELIRSYFGDGSQFGVPIHYSREDAPLGTAGPLSLLRERLTETFLLMNSDILTDLDFRALIAFHRAQSNDVTLALANRKQLIDFGVVRLDGDGQFHEWDEKPVLKFLVSTGIYVMNPRVLSMLPGNSFLNLPDYIVSLNKSGTRIGSYIHEGYWLDIGRREDYEQACRDAESLCLW